MDLRHEWKHEINLSDMYTLRSRLRAVMKPDSHYKDGKYFIRSLYFDNLYDKALREKLDGVNRREKFRIRYYNGDLSYILLEKKEKINALCLKTQSVISKETAERLELGEVPTCDFSDNLLVGELVRKMTTQGLLPKTIVDYTREAFVFPAGGVRVTLDYDIRGTLSPRDFLRSPPTVPADVGCAVLEVKWDDFLPDVIRDIVQLEGRHTSAFSKYAACRMYD